MWKREKESYGGFEFQGCISIAGIEYIICSLGKSVFTFYSRNILNSIVAIILLVTTVGDADYFLEHKPFQRKKW